MPLPLAGPPEGLGDVNALSFWWLSGEQGPHHRHGAGCDAEHVSSRAVHGGKPTQHARQQDQIGSQPPCGHLPTDDHVLAGCLLFLQEMRKTGVSGASGRTQATVDTDVERAAADVHLLHAGTAEEEGQHNRTGAGGAAAGLQQGDGEDGGLEPAYDPDAVPGYSDDEEPGDGDQGAQADDAAGKDGSAAGDGGSAQPTPRSAPGGTLNWADLQKKAAMLQQQQPAAAAAQQAPRSRDKERAAKKPSYNPAAGPPRRPRRGMRPAASFHAPRLCRR